MSALFQYCGDELQNELNTVLGEWGDIVYDSVLKIRNRCGRVERNMCLYCFYDVLLLCD